MKSEWRVLEITSRTSSTQNHQQNLCRWHCKYHKRCITHILCLVYNYTSDSTSWQLDVAIELEGVTPLPPPIRAGKSASAWQRHWEPSKGPESWSRTVYAILDSNSEPERARVCQRVAVRARLGVTESHREPERDRERASVTKKRLASHFWHVLLQNN